MFWWAKHSPVVLGGCFILEGHNSDPPVFISDLDYKLTDRQTDQKRDGQDDKQANMQHDRKTDNQDDRLS